jgi:threonine dehydratase
METFAEGLATRIGFGLPQRIIREQLDDFVLVSDDAIRAAMVLLLEHTRQLVEAAGAAALAGALELRPRLAGKRVAVICSGGNITLEQLRDLLDWAS